MYHFYALLVSFLLLYSVRARLTFGDLLLLHRSGSNSHSQFSPIISRAFDNMSPNLNSALQIDVRHTYQDRIMKCGGVLVTDRWILTAASCAGRGDSFIVRFEMVQDVIEGKDIYVHQWYNYPGQNDLALLKLKRKLWSTADIGRTNIHNYPIRIDEGQNYYLLTLQDTGRSVTTVRKVNLRHCDGICRMHASEEMRNKFFCLEGVENICHEDYVHGSALIINYDLAGTWVCSSADCRYALMSRPNTYASWILSTIYK